MALLCVTHMAHAEDAISDGAALFAWIDTLVDSASQDALPDGMAETMVANALQIDESPKGQARVREVLRDLNGVHREVNGVVQAARIKVYCDPLVPRMNYDALVRRDSEFRPLRRDLEAAALPAAIDVLADAEQSALTQYIERLKRAYRAETRSIDARLRAQFPDDDDAARERRLQAHYRLQCMDAERAIADAS